MDTVPDIDEKLWVELDGDCAGKHFLLGSAHTFPGRIWTWCPRKKVHFNISVCEVVDASRDAVFWLRGFLAGSAPDAPIEPDPPDEPPDGPLRDTPEFQAFNRSVERWLECVVLFQSTGYWNNDARDCDKCGQSLLDAWPGHTCEDCGGTAQRFRFAQSEPPKEAR